MAYSVLVGPSMAETTTLTDSEYETLQNALRLARAWEKGQGLGEDDREARAIASALSYCDATACERGTLRAFLCYLRMDLGEHADDIQGMLVGADEQPILLREEEGDEHVKALKAFLKILEAKNWLRDFFWPVRVERYAKKSPMPLEVMHDLAESAVIFDCDINDAKQMMREWPEVVGNIPSPASAPRGKRAKAQANAEASQSSQALSSKAGA